MTTMFALRTETEVTTSTFKYFLVEMIGYMTQILDHVLGQKKQQMTFVIINLPIFSVSIAI